MSVKPAIAVLCFLAPLPAAAASHDTNDTPAARYRQSPSQRDRSPSR